MSTGRAKLELTEGETPCPAAVPAGQSSCAANRGSEFRIHSLRPVEPANFMSTWLIIAVTATASYLLSLVVRALTSREKKINYQIEHLFPVADEQFLRSMGNLLSPAPLGGNKIT